MAAGTTLGMMLTDIPAVFLGDTIARKVSLPLIRRLATTIFVALGILALLDAGGRLFRTAYNPAAIHS